jgi:MFS family permease
VTLAVGLPVWTALHDRPATVAVAATGPSAVDGPAPAVAQDRLVDAVREVMRRRGTWRGMWAHFTLTGPFAVFTALWGYPFLVRAAHLHPAQASEALALVVLAAVLGAPPVGTLLVRAPGRRATLVYLAAGALLVAWVAALAVGAGNDPAWLLVVLLIVTGFGGPASAAAFDLARVANRPERGGAATGVVNIGGFTGAVVANLVIGALLDTVGHGGHSPGGFNWAMAVVPAMVAAGLAAFCWCGRGERAEKSVTTPPDTGATIRAPL